MTAFTASEVQKLESFPTKLVVKAFYKGARFFGIAVAIQPVIVWAVKPRFVPFMLGAFWHSGARGCKIVPTKSNPLACFLVRVCDSCLMPVRNVSRSGLSAPTNARWMPLLQFSGTPEPGDFDRLINESETLMVQRMPDRRPFRALIECVQNLQRHSAPNTPVEFRLLGRSPSGESRFLIRTVNTLRETDVFRVKQWLKRHHQWQEKLGNQAMESSLVWRGLYRNMLESAKLSPRGGAGLGWISIARYAKGVPSIRLIEDRNVNRLFFSVEVAC